MSDIKDVVAAFQTHHRRAVNVVTKLVPVINKITVIMTLLSEQNEEKSDVYLKVKNDLIESVQDIAEIFDGFTEDFQALCKSQADDIDKVLGKHRGR